MMSVRNVATPVLAVAVAVLVLGSAHTTRGDDIKAVPGAGDAFSVRDSGDTKSQLEVKETGETFVRGAKDMPAAGADTPLCYDATTGQLGTCPPGPGVCVSNVLASPQFVDNGDGTVTDLHTCRMWEQKTGTVDGVSVFCPGGATCDDPHEVDHKYAWSATGSAPDGPVYSDFLARVNGSNPFTGACTLITCTGLGGHTDWRIPTIAELQSILLEPFPCSTSPCIAPDFGPTAPSTYWSATTVATVVPTTVWFVNFGDGKVDFAFKTNNQFPVRAVRGGS